jgi:hypothetical protein
LYSPLVAFYNKKTHKNPFVDPSDEAKYNSEIETVWWGCDSMWRLVPIDVESYSGYKLNESPQSFTFEGRHYNILEIVDRWYEGSVQSDSPLVNYFKVLADDGNSYRIRYDSSHDEWTMVVRLHDEQLP